MSSYDPNARVPKVGTRWVWEIDRPHACELLEVTEVKWNGEEWWVRAGRLHGSLFNSWFASGSAAKSYWNDLDRFWEAVTPVGGNVTARLWERREVEEGVAS